MIYKMLGKLLLTICGCLLILYIIYGVDISASFLGVIVPANKSHVNEINTAINSNIDDHTIWKRIQADEAVAGSKQGTFVFIDTRSEDDYRLSHIIDSIHIPTRKIESGMVDLPKDAKIICYCMCALSTREANMLVKLGYKNVYVLAGGLKAWEDAGGKTASSKSLF